MKFDVTIKDLKKQDLKDLLDLIDEDVSSAQQQPSSGSEQNSESGGSAPISPPATDKQKVLMDKHKIKWDKDTTKVMASDCISTFFDSKKQKEGER